MVVECSPRAARVAVSASPSSSAASFVDAARLRRDADIAAVWSEGIKIQNSMFALRARPNGLALIRIAVAAPRSLGRAVKRNRSRRRLREAFRITIQRLERAPGCDLVIVARSQAGSAAFADLKNGAATALESLSRRVPA